ncbi:MAG TPA: ATP-binding protein, partial [Longimicrobiaceae bacterium]|nr:ATP-binding protein [Longimicrobiaceae bacterium]
MFPVLLVGAVIVVCALAVLGMGRELRRRGELATENGRLYHDVERTARELEEQAAELEAVNEELAAAEARLRGIIDSSLDAIITMSAEGNVLEWNGHAERLFGWPAEEAIGRRLSELIIPPRLREAHERGLHRYLATGEERILNRRVEVVGQRRDGREFPVELTISAARWGSTLVFSAFLRDIGPRRQVEQRLAAEGAVTRVLAESYRLGDAGTRILEAIGSALGWRVGALWVPESGTDTLHAIAVWCSAGSGAEAFEQATRETRLARREGLPGRVWAGGRPAWIEDVTRDPDFPRHEAAAASGLHGAFAFPARDGSMVLAVLEFFHDEVLLPNAPLMEMVAAIGSDIGQAMSRIRAEEERDRALAEMARTNVRIQEANDALAERTAEAERARTAADEANRAKSDFLANMSHELRTPINAIMGYNELLEMEIGGPLTEKQREQLGRVRHSSEHLLALVDDILDLAKVEAGRMEVEQERADVRRVVAVSLSLVEPQAMERGIEVVNDCSESISYVGDEDRVRQILVNLLSNAVKFTEPGGRVTVRCDVARAPGEGARLIGEGPWVRLQVEDTGIGIAADETSEIFQPFVQAEKGRTRTHGGTGLGLAISRQLARLMGGDLTVRSAPGEGSCFSVWLPTGPAPAAAPLLEEVDAALLVAELGPAGEALVAEVHGILDAVTARLRSDPLTTAARRLSDVEIEDHQAALLTDVGKTLVILERATTDPQMIRDSTDLLHTIALRHGAQRARFGWTEEALRRELEILREEIAAALRRH